MFLLIMFCLPGFVSVELHVSVWQKNVLLARWIIKLNNWIRKLPQTFIIYGNLDNFKLSHFFIYIRYDDTPFNQIKINLNHLKSNYFIIYDCTNISFHYLPLFLMVFSFLQKLLRKIVQPVLFLASVILHIIF